MTEYYPDQWILLKIKGNGVLYKVFGSWSGGYLSGASWKMNSGITKVQEDENYYYFHGYSGSVYKCHKSSYGISNVYNYSVAVGFVERTNGIIEIVNEDDIKQVIEELTND